MSDSITLGDYIISTNPSDSTTGGVSLLLFPVNNEEQGLCTTAVSSAQAEIGFWVHVEADDTDTLKTRVDAVTAAITEGAGNAVVKQGSDTIYDVLMATGGYESSNGQTAIHYGDGQALINARIVYIRFQPSAGAGSSGSVGNPEGLVGIPQFTVARDPAGRLRVIATCTFRDTDSNTARENGIAWLREFYPTQSLPDWLPGSDRLRRVDDSLVIQETGDDNTVAGSAVATVTMIDIGSDLANVNSLVASSQTSVTVSTVELDQSAPGLPPRMLTITGTFDQKVDGATAYDSSDSDPTVTMSAIRIAVNEIYDAALQRIGLARSEVQQLSATFGATESGSISYQIEGVTNDTSILAWQETIQHRITSNAVYTSNYGGGEVKHVGGAGGTATVVHTLNVTRIGGETAYKRPSDVEGNNWQLIDVADTAPRRSAARSFIGATAADVTQVQQTFSRTYRFFTADGDFTVGGGLEGTVAEVFNA